MPPASARDANWIDGLRGIASFMVVGGHLCTALVPELHAPVRSPEEGPSLFQLPFLRLVVGGRAAVALFFLITGFVNSIGPISRARSGNSDAALTGIARSALARSGRLVLPATIATIFSWVLANIGAYRMTEHVDSTWIRQGFHNGSPSIGEAITSLLWALKSTWTTEWNEYDGTQWTLPLFLQGSLLVYLTMLATVMVKPAARKFVLAAIWLYYWMAPFPNSSNSLMGMNVAVGMFVAELHNEYGTDATSAVPAPIPFLLIVCGMFLCGYPQDMAESAKWSRNMSDFMLRLTPPDVDIRRYWDSIGASVVLIGIFYSATARRILTSPVFNFLGRVSFPAYLLHNQLIKSVLTWMIYFPSAMNPPHDEEGNQKDLERGSTIHIFAAIIIFYALLYRLAWLWVGYIDPLCARVVKSILNLALDTRNDDSPLPRANGSPFAHANGKPLVHVNGNGHIMEKKAVAQE